MTRRTSKEAALPSGHPLLGIVAHLSSMVRGLQASGGADGADDFIAGKIEGLESALTLIQRAGTNGLADIALPRVHDAASITADTSIEERLASLERDVRSLRERDAIPEASRRVKLPRILETPAPAKRQVDDSKLGRCERALLAVLAQRAGTITTAPQLAVLSGYSVASSSFANALGVLRSTGLAEGTRALLRITPAGKARTGDVSPMPKGRALLEAWCARLGRAEAAMLRELVSIRGVALTREQLADSTGYSLASSSFANAIGKLRSLELATKGWPTCAADVFFEEK